MSHKKLRRRWRTLSTMILAVVAGVGCVADVEDPGASQSYAAAPDAAPWVPGTSHAPINPQVPIVLPDAPRASFVWQGFDHSWQRREFGFRIPHRISRFDSKINSIVSTGDEAGAQAVFAQSTGVDGNFMDPRLRWSAFSSSDVFVEHDAVNFAWTDNGTGGSFPTAATTLTQNIDVPLPSWVDNAEAILRGVKIDSTCNQLLQPAGETCNSNGFWPSQMRFSVDQCVRDSSSLKCTITTTIDRAWTPDRGGGKPFNDALTFNVRVLYTVVGGGEGEFWSRRDNVLTTGEARQNAPQTINRTLTAPAGSAGIVGLTRFGFRMLRTGTQNSRRRLGRYIGRVNFGLEPGTYDPSSGTINVNHVMQVWVPDTVHPSDVSYDMQTSLLVFDSPDARASRRQVAVGDICVEGGPWVGGCTAARGPEQIIDRVPLRTNTAW